MIHIAGIQMTGTRQFITKRTSSEGDDDITKKKGRKK